MIPGYTNFEPIGEGGWAQVFRAVDDHGGPVAVKVMRAELSRDASAVRRFEREGRLMRGLVHASIPRVIDVTRTREGRPALVMDFVRGRDLRASIARGPLPYTAVVAIGIGVARALDHAHERGVIHRDINPSNVMLVDDIPSPDSVRVLDFGIAFSVYETRITRGTNVGTDAYTAPEQRARAAILASDLYSLGVTLFHLATGRLAGASSMSSGDMAREDRSPGATSPRMPETLERLLRSMMAPDPLMRPASAREVEHKLIALDRGASTATAADTLHGLIEQLRARELELRAQRVELERLLAESTLGGLSSGEVSALRSLETAETTRVQTTRDLERRTAALNAALAALTPQRTA